MKLIFLSLILSSGCLGFNVYEKRVKKPNYNIAESYDQACFVLSVWLGNTDKNVKEYMTNIYWIILGGRKGSIKQFSIHLKEAGGRRLINAIVDSDIEESEKKAFLQTFSEYYGFNFWKEGSHNIQFDQQYKSEIFLNVLFRERDRIGRALLEKAFLELNKPLVEFYLDNWEYLWSLKKRESDNNGVALYEKSIKRIQLLVDLRLQYSSLKQEKRLISRAVDQLNLDGNKMEPLEAIKYFRSLNFCKELQMDSIAKIYLDVGNMSKWGLKSKKWGRFLDLMVYSRLRFPSSLRGYVRSLSLNFGDQNFLIVVLQCREGGHQSQFSINLNEHKEWNDSTKGKIALEMLKNGRYIFKENFISLGEENVQKWIQFPKNNYYCESHFCQFRDYPLITP